VVPTTARAFPFDRSLWHSRLTLSISDGVAGFSRSLPGEEPTGPGGALTLPGLYFRLARSW
jgi:hypothetical protein